MIIDDGSSDNTGEVVNKWVSEENKFTIIYTYKSNGGLHTAYNEAIKQADTELMVCVDSDDYLTDNAVELILELWDSTSSSFVGGIIGLDILENGDIIGDVLPNKKTINLIDLLCNKYKIRQGDRKIIVKTELYKRVAPMPSYEGEKNFNPHYMNLQISIEYDFLVLNEPLCVVKYLESGMTSNIFRQYLNSPKSFAQTRRLYLSFSNTTFRFRLKTSIHYISSCIIGREKNILEKTNHKLLIVFAIPFGVLLYMYIKYRADKC